MIEVALYEIELHPESRDGAPNAWRATGFDHNGNVAVVACGNTAADALRQSEINRIAQPLHPA